MFVPVFVGMIVPTIVDWPVVVVEVVGHGSSLAPARERTRHPHGDNERMEPIRVTWRRVEDVPDTWPLSAAETARMDAIGSPARRQEYAAGARLLRMRASAAVGVDPGSLVIDRHCPDCAEQHGRPVITGPVNTGSFIDVGCSVSHSAGLVAVAIGTGRIGLDIEQLREIDFEPLLSRVLAPGETAPASAYGFQRMWCRKEAVIKATGEGLRRPMSSVRLDGDEARVLDLDLGEGVIGAVARLGQEPFEVVVD